jgi:hypothetical protein
MRQRLFPCCAIALLAASSGAARAQGVASSQTEWGLLAGVEMATGAFRNLDPGFAIGVLAQTPLSNGRLALRTDVLFASIGNNPCGDQCDAIYPYSFVVSGSFSLIARVNDPMVPWSPYAIAGATAYFAESLPQAGAGTPSRFGVEGGVGFEVRLSGHTLFAEARYMTISPGGIVPVCVGVRF